MQDSKQVQSVEILIISFDAYSEVCNLSNDYLVNRYRLNRITL